MGNQMGEFAAQILEGLQKALDSGGALPLIKEDLEPEAHNSLYQTSSPNELRLLKCLARGRATSIKHEFDLINSYSGNTASGFFGEKSLPLTAKVGSSRHQLMCKLQGEINQVFAFANFQTPIRALGANSLVGINSAATRESILRKINRNLYIADTKFTRSSKKGGPDIRWKGIKQQIREATDKTDTGTGVAGDDTGFVAGRGSIFGSHIINMDGKRLTIDKVQEWGEKLAENYGCATALFMPPLQARIFEQEIANMGNDSPLVRLLLPRKAGEHVLLGTSVGGLNTGGGLVYFEIDNGLTPHHLYPKPPEASELLDSTDPNFVPVPNEGRIVANANNEIRVDGDLGGNAWVLNAPLQTGSKWDPPHTNAGREVYYKIAYVKNEIVGGALRIPTNPDTFIDVDNGGSVTLTFGHSGNSKYVPAGIDSIRIYRGDKSDSGDPLLIAEVGVQSADMSNETTKTITWVDLNTKIPGTYDTFLLSIASKNYMQIKAAGAHYQQALPSLDMENPPGPKNTIKFVTLGPFMGVYELGRIGFTAVRDLMFTAGTPEVAIPYQNVVFENCGTE